MVVFYEASSCSLVCLYCLSVILFGLSGSCNYLINSFNCGTVVVYLCQFVVSLILFVFNTAFSFACY